MRYNFSYRDMLDAMEEYLKKRGYIDAQYFGKKTPSIMDRWAQITDYAPEFRVSFWCQKHEPPKTEAKKGKK